ncbi:hypothetical protein XENOCAPTIV_030976 [Xenoophorus captivus]|uniref:Uncharacterized protein n=1 Tax=Xenoophorus captivus TaxID=1517983 RepID=A0ABV0RX64_9TELE
MMCDRSNRFLLKQLVSDRALGHVLTSRTGAELHDSDFLSSSFRSDGWVRNMWVRLGKSSRYQPEPPGKQNQFGSETELGPTGFAGQSVSCCRRFLLWERCRGIVGVHSHLSSLLVGLGRFHGVTGPVK